MQFRCLLAGVALVLGGSLAACDGGDDSATPLTTTSSPAESTTTATTAPTTSTTLDFETEVKLAALELIEVRNQNLMSPNVDRVSEYISETCVCRAVELGTIEEFVAQGRYWTGPAIEPLAIRLDDPNPRNPAFTMVGRQPGGSIVSPNEERQVPEVPIAPLFVSLVRSDDGEWRLNGLDEVPLNEDAARRIIDEVGLP